MKQKYSHYPLIFPDPNNLLTKLSLSICFSLYLSVSLFLSVSLSVQWLPTSTNTSISLNKSQYLSRPDPTPQPDNPTRPIIFEIISSDPNRQPTRRLTQILKSAPFANRIGSDVKLTVSAREGLQVPMDVHGEVLARRSRFFRERLCGERDMTHEVEIICECDDVEVYVETVVLMYCDDVRRKVMGEDVSKVLALLEVCAAVLFDDGIVSCLEFLEAVPWSKAEEEKVISQLNQLHLEDSISIPRVLQRVSSETSTSSRTNDICLKLFNGVLQAKDDKARREMKSLIIRLLREDSSDHSNNGLDISKDTLYYLCHGCLSSLVLCLSEATSVDAGKRDRGAFMAEIAREADNMQWVVDILIQQRVGEEFVKLWADQKELAILHSKIPSMYRHEISRITAQLCIVIGRGRILVLREIRYSLLSTWLEALYDDFGWMRRSCRSIDKKLIEDGLSQTVLTLPLLQQQAILLDCFDRFLNKGDDCPNIQRAFEVWWKRAFVRQYVAESKLQLTVCDYAI